MFSDFTTHFYHESLSNGDIYRRMDYIVGRVLQARALTLQKSL